MKSLLHSSLFWMILAAFLTGNLLEKIFVRVGWPDHTDWPIVACTVGVVLCVAMAMRELAYDLGAGL